MNNNDIKKLEKFIGVSKEIKETPEYVFIENIEIEKEQYLEIVHIIEDLIEENKMLNNKQTKIIADSFHEKMAEKFNENFILKSEVIEKANNYESKGYIEIAGALKNLFQKEDNKGDGK